MSPVSLNIAITQQRLLLRIKTIPSIYGNGKQIKECDTCLKAQNSGRVHFFSDKKSLVRQMYTCSTWTSYLLRSTHHGGSNGILLFFLKDQNITIKRSGPTLLI